MKTPNVNNFLFELTIIAFLFSLVLIITSNVDNFFHKLQIILFFYILSW